MRQRSTFSNLKNWFWVFTFGIGVGACGGSSSSPTLSEGIGLPESMNAVAENNSANANVASGGTITQGASLGFGKLLQKSGISDSFSEDSDFKTAKVRRGVELEALKRFEIINQIFNAISQTKYDLPENIDHAPYKCMVAFQDEGDGGVTLVQLEPWVVHSYSAVNSAGVLVNRLDAWIQEEALVRARVDIQQAPTRDASDPTKLIDLGIWKISASCDNFTFYADSVLLEDGTTRLRILNTEEESHGELNTPAGGYVTKAILYRNLDLGYGKITLPNEEACYTGGDPNVNCPNGPPNMDVKFSYNDHFLTIDQNGSQTSFDRLDPHELVHKYKLYNSSGEDVEQTKNFGFPVRLPSSGGFGWYGTDPSGETHLWVGGQTPTDGTTVVRADTNPNADPVVYTTKTFQGSLTKIDLVAGDLDMVADVPSEIFIFNNFDLIYDSGSSHWMQCLGNDGMGGCNSLVNFDSHLSDLGYNGAGDQRFIQVMKCNGGPCTNYIYSSTPSPGLYNANFDPNTNRWVSTGAIYNPQNNDRLFVNIGGSAYIEYIADFDGSPTHTGWVQKKVTAFDQSTHTATFDDNQDSEFYFELNREYFINKHGQNLRVKRVATNGNANDYTVYLEVHTTINPENFSSLVNSGSTFENSWDPSANSTYSVEVDPNDSHFLLLKYKTVSSNDANGVVGEVVENDLWGLKLQGDNTHLYNWQFQSENEFWGSVTYLLDSEENYVMLSAPMRFESVKLARTQDIIPTPVDPNLWKSFSLSYAGFMEGVPDTWRALRDQGFEASGGTGVLGQNVRIPDGTELTLSGTSTKYYTKAIDIGIFLGIVNAFAGGTAPDLSLANGVDLSTVPAFVSPGLSATVPSAELKYIQGLPVE